MSDLADVFGEPNGRAYQAQERRHGVPLDYVAEKMRASLVALHSAVAALPDPVAMPDNTRERLALYELRSAFELCLTSYLALSNMLAGLRDQQLPNRLLTYDRAEFGDWLDRIDEGSLYSEPGC